MLRERMKLRDRTSLYRWRDADRGASGLSLVEVLVALTATALIMGPLAMVMITTFKTTGEVEDDLNRGNDAQRIGAAWTSDVRNVDVGGVNTGAPCHSESTSLAEETHLVSFTWNEDPDAVGEVHTATWMARGFGEDLSLIRRVCIGGDTSSVQEQFLAKNIGVDGMDVTQVVKGPGADPRDFCPPVDRQTDPAGAPVMVSESCTIVVDGTFDYRLDVTRRVADPLDSGLPSTAPAAPVINDAVGRNRYITVSWDLLSPVAGQPPVEQYQLFLYEDPNGLPVASTVVDSASNFASISGLTNGNNYFAKVQAKNAVGWGSLSLPFGPVSPHPTGPEAPTVPSVAPGNHQIIVNWSPNPNDGGSAVTEWHLYAIDLNDVEQPVKVVSPGSATSGVIDGLENGTSYRVVVAGVNAVEEGVRSEFSEVVVPFGAPPPAGEVAAQANEGQASVRWLAPDDDNGRPIVGYVLRTYQGEGQTVAADPAGHYYSVEDAGCTEEAVNPPDPQDPGATYTVCEVTESLTNANYYRFTVAARSDVGDGTTIDGAESPLSGPFPSPAVQPKNPPYVRPSTAPSKPSTPSVAAAAGPSLSVTATVPDGNGEPVAALFVEYQRKSTGSGSSWPGTWTEDPTVHPVSAAAGQDVTVSVPAQAGYVYRVRVSAANKGEWYSPSASWRKGPVSNVSGTATVVGAPGKPTITSVTRTAGNTYPFSVTANWAAPADDGGSCVDQYQVQISRDGASYSTTETFPASPSCAGAASGTSVDIGGLLAGAGGGTTYARVRAHTAAGGWSGWSNADSTTSLRQDCTLNATETAWVGDDHNGKKKGTDKLSVQYTDKKDNEKNHWSYVKFNQRTDGTDCIEFGLPLPGAALIGGTPTGYGSAPANTAIVTANRTGGPSGGQVAIHQANGSWTESGISWDNKPGRTNETDHISGGGNGSRWWWVEGNYAISQRSSNRNGWILGQKDGGDEWTFSNRSSGSPPQLKIRFR